MRFFIPHAADSDDEIRIYQAIKNHLTAGLGAAFSEERIFSIRYKHDGKDGSAQVGEIESRSGELVVAILYEPGRSLYHVCTPNRGVLKDMSILVGGNEIRDIEYFEN